MLGMPFYKVVFSVAMTFSPGKPAVMLLHTELSGRCGLGLLHLCCWQMAYTGGQSHAVLLSVHGTAFSHLPVKNCRRKDAIVTTQPQDFTACKLGNFLKGWNVQISVGLPGRQCIFNLWLWCKV